MPDLLARIVHNLIPLVIAFGLAGLCSKLWVPLGSVGAVGVYFILIGATAHFESGGASVVAVLYGVTTLAGMILLVGGAGRRLGRRDPPR